MVSTNGVSNTVSGYTVSGSTVTLTLGTDVQFGMKRRELPEQYCDVGVVEEGDGLDHGFNGDPACRR